MYVDVHCHLDQLKDINAVIDRARGAGVGIILTAGVNEETNRKTIELADKFDEVRAALGVYPVDALAMSDEELNLEIAWIKRQKDRIVGIGEVGMDFKESGEAEKQREIFSRFVNLALDIRKPIIVHSRKAEEECIDILEELGAEKVVMHCFSGKIRLVKRIVDNGWMLSVPTCVTHAEHFQRIVKDVDISQLLCETDAPWLHPAKDFPNEPGNVKASYEKIAEIKEMSVEEVRDIISDNYNSLFSHK